MPEQEQPSIEDCAKDLIQAIHNKDASAVVQAIQDIMSHNKEEPDAADQE